MRINIKKKNRDVFVSLNSRFSFSQKNTSEFSDMYFLVIKNHFFLKLFKKQTNYTSI